MKLDTSSTPLTKINLKWIKYLSVRSKTIKLLEESIGENLFYISLGDFSLDINQKQKCLNKWDYIKLRSFCTVNEKMNKMKRYPT